MPKEIPITTKMDVFDDALSERGVVPLHAIDNAVCHVMSDIIGCLHRQLEARGVTPDQIRDNLRNQLLA